MNVTKLLRWGLLALLVGTTIAYPFFEQRYQSLRQKGWTTYFATDRQKCDLSHANIVVDSQQYIWILGQGECDFFESAHIFDGTSWTELELGGKYSGNYEIDSAGRLWRLKEKKGDGGKVLSVDIEVFNDVTWSNFVSIDGKTLDDRFGGVNGFAIDKKGSIWVLYTRLPSKQKPSLWTNGISIFDGQAWSTFNGDNTPWLAVARVWGLSFDNQDRAWFFSDDGRLYVFDGKYWKSISTIYEKIEEYGGVVSFAFDSRGTYWVATEYGFIISTDGKQVIDLNRGSNIGYIFPGNDYLSFAFDRNNQLWVAHDRLLLFDGKAWKTLTHKNAGFAKGYVTDLEIDGADKVWIVTPSGISVFNPKEGLLPSPKLVDLWGQLRGDEVIPLGQYWILPFFIFLTWFAVLFQKNSRWSAVSFLLGVLQLSPLVFFLVLGFLVGTMGTLLWEMVALMLPLGVLGTVISSIALAPFGSQDKKGRKMATIGLILSILGAVVSLAFRLLIRY